MAAPKKALSPAQVRERRSKIAAVVLGVVFLGVAGIQGPKLLKQLSGKHAAATAAGASTSATSGGAQSVADGTPSLAAQSFVTGQLSHFARFAMKDPFHAQVKTIGPAASVVTGASGAAGGSLAVVPPTLRGSA